MDQFEQAMKMAIEYIGKRLRTKHEVTEKLSMFFDRDVTSRVIDRLIGQKLIDDDNYVSCYIRDRSKLNPMGRMKIRQELLQRGIAPDIIDENQEYICIDEAMLISGIIKKKKNKYGLEQSTNRKKLACYLYRRGFDPVNIKIALNLYDIGAD